MHALIQSMAPHAIVISTLLVATTSHASGMSVLSTSENQGPAMEIQAPTQAVAQRMSFVLATCSDTQIAHLFVPDDVRFHLLVKQWDRERGTTSSITQMAICPSYQQIIGMGRDRAVPLVLRQIQEEGNDPDHWFWALRALTGADPVSPADRGDMLAMARAWLAWGASKGYVA